MRLRSLIILIAFAGVAVYLYLFQWDFITGLFEDVRLNMAGYTAAKTPEDAMDRFAKAIKARDYNGAARYCTKEFAGNLIKGKKAAYELSYRIDRLIALMSDKGLQTDRSMIILYSLDPFPGLFERSTDKKIEEIKGKEERYGWYKSEPVKFVAAMDKVNGLDAKMFRNALMPPNNPVRPEFSNTAGFYYKVKLVPEGDGDQRIWKLDIPLDEYTKDETDHMVKQYRSYANGMDNLLDYIRRGRYDGPKAFEDELITVLNQQNQSK